MNEDWWYEAFAIVPYEKAPPGAGIMLNIVAYDITEPRRLARVAKICEAYGVRVQYSLFECRLRPEEFDELWLKILEVIDEGEDRVVSYPLDARCAKDTVTAGTMVCSEQAVCYLV